MSSDSTDPRMQILQKWSDEGLLAQAGFSKQGLGSSYDDDDIHGAGSSLDTMFLAGTAADTRKALAALGVNQPTKALFGQRVFNVNLSSIVRHGKIGSEWEEITKINLCWSSSRRRCGVGFL